MELVEGTLITVNYTRYEYWEGKSYYGKRSGTKAVPTHMNVTVGKTTEKAIQLINGTKKKCWVPKSKVTMKDNVLTVNKGFCYYVINKGEAFPSFK